MVEENKLEKTNTIKNKTIVLVSLILPLLLIIGFLLKPIFLKNNEEISLGDINETMDYQFRVSWNDYGYESYRPQSVKYDLYNVLDEDTVVSSVTLSFNQNTHVTYGTFSNVPKYNSNNSLAKYIIKQEPIDNYTQTYNKSVRKGLCIEFGNDIEFSGNETYLVFLFKNTDNDRHYLKSRYSNEKFYANDLKNKTVCIPTPQTEYFEIYGGSTSRLEIKRIYPVDNVSYSSTKYNRFTIFRPYYGDYYPSRSPAAYSWQSTTTNFPGADIIYNGVNYYDYSYDVEWEDTDYESIRPSEVTVNLYNENDLSIVLQTQTLNITNTTYYNRWSGTFKNVARYNEDGTKAKYIIKPIPQNNYVNYYDRKYDANATCIEFGENVFNGDESKTLRIGYLSSIVYLYQNRTDIFKYNDLKNKTICVPSYNGIFKLFLNGDISNLDIKYIYPDYNPFSESIGYDSEDDVKEDFFNENYPQNSANNLVSYMFKSSKKPFPNANLIKFSYNKYDLKFDKYWENDSSEYRPNSSEFYLYRKDNLNEVLSTVVLDSSNVDPDDSNHWIGTFKNIRKYDDNGNRIEYAIREKPIPNYITSYDSKDGLSIKFNENTKFGYSSAAHLYVYNPFYGWKNFVNNVSYSSLGDNVGGKTYDLSFLDDKRLQSLNSSLSSAINLDPKDTIFGKIIEFIGQDYPEMYHNTSLMDDYTYMYSYSLSDHSQKLFFTYRGDSWQGDYGLKIDKITTIGDEVIITSRLNFRDLEITKEWDDKGYENLRPSNVTIDIYSAKDLNNPIKTVQLSTSDIVDEYTWKKTINNLPKYDESLAEIEYIISERKISDDYITVYDADPSYNGLAIEFADDIYGVGYIYTGYSLENGTLYYSGNGRKGYYHPRTGRNSGYQDDISGRTAFIKTKNLYLKIDNNSEYDNVDGNFNVKINDIYPVQYTNSNSHTTNLNSYGNIYDLGISSYNDYLDVQNNDEYVNKYLLWEYKWEGSLVPKKNCFIIRNKINKTSIPIEKEWNDPGFESNRPEKVKFNLYNIKDETKIVSTLELTKSNENHNNSHEWKGTFNNIPKFNNNGTVAEYIVKEVENDKYDVKYNLNKTGYCVKMTSYFKQNNNVHVNFRVKNGDDYLYISNKNNSYSNNIVNASLKNGEICFETDSDDIYIEYNNRNNGKQITWYGGHELNRYFYYNYPLIESIYPVNLEEYDYSVGTQKDTTVHDYVEVRDNEPFDTYERNYRLPDRMSYYYQTYIHYKWEPKDETFVGSDIIINTANMRSEQYIKEFDDTGYELFRPKELKFALYEINGIMPREIKTINTRNCNENVCEIDFGGVMDKDIDGNPINYRIVELETYGYDVSYEDNKVINKAVPIDVNITKVDDENNKLAGAKIGIYKDDTEILTYVTSNEVYETKLLPGEYIIKELEVPKGYKKSFDINIKVNEDGTIEQDNNVVDVITIVNEKIIGFDIKIKKTMKDSNDKFNFRITIENFNDAVNYIGDKTGTLVFKDGVADIELGANEYIILKDIPIDSKYEIVELEEDYNLTIKGTNEGILKQNTEIEFINEKKVVPIVEPTPSTIDDEVIDAVNGNDDKETLTGDDEQETQNGDEETNVKTPITGITSYLKYIGLLVLISVVIIFVIQKRHYKNNN